MSKLEINLKWLYVWVCAIGGITLNESVWETWVSCMWLPSFSLYYEEKEGNRMQLIQAIRQSLITHSLLLLLQLVTQCHSSTLPHSLALLYFNSLTTVSLTHLLIFKHSPSVIFLGSGSCLVAGTALLTAHSFSLTHSSLRYSLIHYLLTHSFTHVLTHILTY